MYTDADLDGLGDFCERNLALKFAPEFRTWSLDNTGGEPHWAGSPGPNGTVRIVYLPAYYRDEGSPSYLCNHPPPFWHWSCEGHNGDSEAVMLELTYLEA